MGLCPTVSQRCKGKLRGRWETVRNSMPYKGRKKSFIQDHAYTDFYTFGNSGYFRKKWKYLQDNTRGNSKQFFFYKNTYRELLQNSKRVCDPYRKNQVLSELTTNRLHVYMVRFAIVQDSLVTL